MQFVESGEIYLESLLNEIEKANKSIYLQAMLFEHGKTIQLLEDQLIKAKNRGVEVVINYDWVSEKYYKGELYKFPPLDKAKRENLNKQNDKNDQMYERLEFAGIKLNKINNANFIGSAFPYLGRNHIKISIIDENVCWLGGINLFDMAFEAIDFMVKSTNEKLVTALTSQFFKINENSIQEDYSKKIDDLETLYVDAGSKGKSIILDTAIESIRKAMKSVIFMSQFVPDTKLLKEMEEASSRGVEIVIYTSPADNPNFTNYPEKLTYVMLKNSMSERENMKLIHLMKKVHAKLLIIDNKVALYGSHNYTYSGVLFGTAEIMMETKDSKILKELNEFIEVSQN